MKTVFRKSLVIGLYGLLATPLFFAKHFMFPFIAPKVFVFQAIAALVFGIWLFLALLDREYRPRLTWLTAAVLLFLGVMTVASLSGLDLHRSLWSTQERALGLVALYHFAAIFLVLGSLREKLDWQRYFEASFWVSLVAAAGAVLHIYDPGFFFDQNPEVVRPGSFLGNPSFLAAYLLFHIFLGLWIASRRYEVRSRQAPLYLAGVLFEIGIIFLAQTRGAIIGLALGGVALLLFLALQKGEERPWGVSARFLRRISLGILGAGAAAIILFLASSSAAVWQKVPGVSRLAGLSLESADIQPRLIALRIGWRSFLERPLQGFGFENFKYPFDKKYDPRLLRSGFTETYFDKPHNVYLEYLVTGGIFALLAYLALVMVFFYELWRRAELRGFAPFATAAMAAYLGQNGFLFDTFGAYLMLFILLAAGDRYAPALRLPQGEIRRMPAVIAAGALALAAAFLPNYFINGPVLYANNAQYWGLNYLLIREPEAGLAYWNRALAAPTPYRDGIRKDFAANISQLIAQEIRVPDVNKTISQALEALVSAINNHPNDYYLRLSLADVATSFSFVNPNYLSLAEAQIEEASKSSPLRQQIYYSRSKLRLVQGKPMESLDFMRQAVELDPEAPDPHFYYALTALQAGQPEIGFRELEEARRFGRAPETADEARILANYYAEYDRYDEAITYYAAALRLNPDDLDALLKLGLTYYYKGDMARAKEFFREVAGRTDLKKAPLYLELQAIFRESGIEI